MDNAHECGRQPLPCLYAGTCLCLPCWHPWRICLLPWYYVPKSVNLLCLVLTTSITNFLVWGGSEIIWHCVNCKSSIVVNIVFMRVYSKTNGKLEFKENVLKKMWVRYFYLFRWTSNMHEGTHNKKKNWNRLSTQITCLRSGGTASKGWGTRQ